MIKFYAAYVNGNHENVVIPMYKNEIEERILYDLK